MVALLMYLKQPNFIYLWTYLWLATLAVANAQLITKGIQPLKEDSGKTLLLTPRRKKMTEEPMEVAALGRPLSLGMLYDCRKDSFIPGITLWDKKSLSENLDSHPQPKTNLQFSSSDSLSSKFNLLDVSASLKASFLGGLVEVRGSGKFLSDTKSSHQQSRVTMFYSETTRFEQLTMSQLGQFTYPQVFDQKTATHVVTAVLYGAQAIMVFDLMNLAEEKERDINGNLTVLVQKISQFSTVGKGFINMTDSEKKMAMNIICTFYGDFLIDQNPTTYKDALQTYKTLPTLIKENPQNVVPIKVWLHPLHLLDSKAAQLEREISTRQVYYTERIIEELGEAERTCNDLIGNTLVNSLSDIKERLLSFQDSFSIYNSMLLKAVGRVLPAVRGGEMEEMSLEHILTIHSNSPFSAEMLKKWLNDAETEFYILSSKINMLQGIKMKDSVDLIYTLFDPDIDAVVSLTFTSLKYEDPFLSTLKEFLKTDRFKELDRNNTSFPITFVSMWFSDNKVRKNIRESFSQFRRFAEANKGEERIRFIISAISNPSIAGSSIYLYEKGNLTDTQFKPKVSKPSPPIVKNVLAPAVSLKLQKSSSRERVQYRVEYKQAEPDSGAEEPWIFKYTHDEDITLTGLESGKHYLIRCRIVGKVGVSEASDTVSATVSAHPSIKPVIVGGTGGDEFSFKSTLRNTFQKIIITYSQRQEGFWFWSSEHVTLLNTIQVNFQDYQMIKVGRVEGNTEKEFLFDDTDKVVAAKLWPNKDHTRFGGLEFVVEKIDGARITMSIRCDELGEPVIVNVGSGRCYGITGRSGDEIDALGFYFI